MLSECLQPVPIPSYLLALAVGDLESRRIGPRSQVWSEPSVVDAAAYEFANTDNYLTTGAAHCILLLHVSDAFHCAASAVLAVCTGCQR